MFQKKNDVLFNDLLMCAQTVEFVGRYLISKLDLEFDADMSKQFFFRLL